MSDADVYKKQGFGNCSGFGRSPALLIVDFTVAFNDPEQFGGGNISVAIERTAELLAAARDALLPIAYTRVVYAEDGSDLGVFALKAPGLRTLTEASPASQIVPELAPEVGDYIIRKTQPSAFFGTGLAGWLVSKCVDSVIVTGCTTSGCVRASVIDCMSYNFRTIVATDGVGDRALAPHEANLFDMGQKYADLHTCEEIMTHIGKARPAMA